MRIVGCFLEFDNTFVILLRHSHKPDGNTWGLPGGKVEANESDQAAVARELEEETGFKAASSDIEHLGDYDFISSTGKPYVYATFKVRLKKLHRIRLENSAHADFQWVTPEECYAKPDLISGFYELLRLVGYIK